MTQDSKPAFTPGPWHIGTGADGWPLISTERKYGGYEEIVASVYRPSSHVRMAGVPDCHEHNARLIAAAPDLLDALKAAIDCGMVPVSTAAEGGATKYSLQVTVADMIRAALAKAEGC